MNFIKKNDFFDWKHVPRIINVTRKKSSVTIDSEKLDFTDSFKQVFGNLKDVNISFGYF